MRHNARKYNPPTVVARECGEAVGWAILTPPDRRYREKLNGLQIYVLPTCRRRGVGRRLIHKLLPLATPEIRYWSSSPFFNKVLE